MAQIKFSQSAMMLGGLNAEQAAKHATKAIEMGADSVEVGRHEQFRDSIILTVRWPNLRVEKTASSLISILQFVASVEGVTFEDLLRESSGH